MGAIQALNKMGIDQRLLHIVNTLRTLDISRKASQAVRALTAPIEDRVAEQQQAIERIRRLADMPLPEFKQTEE